MVEAVLTQAAVGLVCNFRREKSTGTTLPVIINMDARPAGVNESCHCKISVQHTICQIQTKPLSPSCDFLCQSVSPLALVHSSVCARTLKEGVGAMCEERNVFFQNRPSPPTAEYPAPPKKKRSSKKCGGTKYLEKTPKPEKKRESRKNN